MTDLILFNPPLTQLNTPYPGIAFLSGFLKSQGFKVQQYDLGIHLISELFTKKKLEEAFEVAALKLNLSADAKRVLALKQNYLEIIEPIIRFMSGQDTSLVYRIAARNFLPEGKRFKSLQGSDELFGSMGIRDKAQYFATLFLEELADFIKETISPHFGFSRYAESLAVSASSFDPLYSELQKELSICDEIYISEALKIVDLHKPMVVGLSAPFPGNVFASFAIAKAIKKNHPQIKIAFGGGYANTELRDLSEARVFEFFDYICLDDGYRPLLQILSAAKEKLLVPATGLKRSFILQDGKVYYENSCTFPDPSHAMIGTPSYDGLKDQTYLQVIDIANPMHRVWGHGRWNKIMFAHGCYWRRCTFCDTSLNYILHYDMAKAAVLVDQMDAMFEQTGEIGFHGVDEAAPPALLRDLAIELLKRKRNYTYWTNIRYDKNFTYDLCRLLAKSGMIAVSGGIEVASERLLKLINKGVTIQQVTLVTRNFMAAGIMTHGYLMYGFPTQTEQETIDALEVVRQLFEQNLLLSGFWHRLSVTRHAPLGMRPEAFGVVIHQKEKASFANNDLAFSDQTGIDHTKFSAGLEKSLYNFMHNNCLDNDLQSWFDFDIPPTTISPDLIEGFLETSDELGSEVRMIWIGGEIEESRNYKKHSLVIHCQDGPRTIQTSLNEINFMKKLILETCVDAKPMSLVSDFEFSAQELLKMGIEQWLESPKGLQLRELGLLLL